MARKSGHGYHGYRGRRGGSGGSLALKIIVILLAVILAAGILFALFLGRYIEYTDGGVRLNLPWGQQEPSLPPIASTPVVIVSDEPATPSPDASLTAIGAVAVTPEQLLDGSAAQAVALEGGSALVVEMKGSDGRLAWLSQSALAGQLGTNASDDGLARAIALLAEQDELYLVARISCFRDQALALAGLEGCTLMTQGGNIWYDPQGLCWVSPASQTVVDYLSTLCRELSDMGFDEILLDSAGYPDQGEIHVLAGGDARPEDLTVPVAACYGALAQTLADTPTVLSVLTTEDALLGVNTFSGVTPALLAGLTGRVWAPAPAAEGNSYAGILEQAGMEPIQHRLVTVDPPEPETEGSWARLSLS